MRKPDESTGDLFSESSNQANPESLKGPLPPSSEVPLAQRMRPTRLEDISGQSHFLNLRFHRLLESDRWTGFIFWGPPGSGKTTLAGVIARKTDRPFHSLSAVVSGVKDIRAALELSRSDVRRGAKSHVIFIDEVHRLNKAQQDVLLPYLEEGSARFIGATTENPSFEINNAIASRCVIFHFEPLGKAELLSILKRAAPELADELLEKIADASLGDARRALTLLEHLLLSSQARENGELPGAEDFDELKHSQSLYYDKKSEAHYDTISAFIKSIRGGDPDAGLYYLARMLEGGEDPIFIARRLTILASEDIGNANPAALMLASAAFQSVHQIGMPEARIVLGQLVTYLACSEKSNRSYKAVDAAIACVRETGNLEIPLHLRNAPTRAMKDWGYGKGYQYPHSAEGGWVKEDYLPNAIRGKRFYLPTQRGSEKRFQEHLERTKKANVPTSEKDSNPSTSE